jgi:hypothetical protein
VTAAPAARRDLLLGACALGGGLLVAWLAAGIRGMPGQPFSPGFVPGIVGTLAAMIGLALVLRAMAGHAPPIAEEETEGHGRPLRLAADDPLAHRLPDAARRAGGAGHRAVWRDGFRGG